MLKVDQTNSFKEWRERIRSMSIDELNETKFNIPEEKTKGIYEYPLLYKRVNILRLYFLKKGIPKDQLYTLGVFVCAKSPESHIGPFLHAIDFLVPDGTPIFASAEGTILEIKEDSSLWGDNQKFRNKLNYVTIQHFNGEFSQYCHVLRNSVSSLNLKLGQKVFAGQQIGRVGKSGWTDRDHLHFIVFKNIACSHNFKSLKVLFKSH